MMSNHPAESFLSAVSFVLPKKVETNEDLNLENPDWDVERIATKTGIHKRHIVASDQTALDLGFDAAEILLSSLGTDRATIDFLLFCTQSPDYLLPTSACILQDRLGLPTTCAAMDFNQGCSGYIYGLFLAKSMIASGLAKKILLINAETYSKYIHPKDRSVRVLFGDAGSASLITTDSEGSRIGDIVLGTDGSGFRNLIVPAGGARLPNSADTRIESTDENGCVRSQQNLFMDGQELFRFTLKRVPEVVDATLRKAGLNREQVDWFVFHQANAFMNEHLCSKMKIPAEKSPIRLGFGNTVSCTIPVTLCQLGTQITPGSRVMFVGFGVGYSWGACLLDWGAPTCMVAD